MNEIVPLLFFLAPAVPFLVIYFVGGTLCLVRRRRHPRLSRLALIAFILLFARVLIGVTLRNWLVLRRSDFGWDQQTLSVYLAMVHSCDVLIGIVAWVFLLIALFSRRDLSIPTVLHDSEERFGSISDTAIREGRSPFA